MIGGNHETASTLSAIEGRNNLRLFCDDYMGRVVCLCGDAMITVSHYLELADVSWCIADTIIGETRDDMALYFIGHAKPNYPVPAIQYRTKYDYSDLRVNTVIGLMMGDFTHHWLVVYWPRD